MIPDGNLDIHKGNKDGNGKYMAKCKRFLLFKNFSLKDN